MRNQGEVRFERPRVTRTMKVVAMVLVGVWLAQVLLGAGAGDRFGIFRWLTLKPSAVLEGLQLWRVLTYALLGDPGDVVAVVLDVVLVLLFGSALEERIGRSRSLAAMLGASLFGALAVVAVSRFDLALVHAQTVSPSAAVTALAVAWGLHRSNERLEFLGAIAMRGKHFALLTAGLAIVGYLASRTGSHLAAIAGVVAGAFVAQMRAPARAKLTVGTARLRAIPGGRDDPKRWLN